MDYEYDLLEELKSNIVHSLRESTIKFDAGIKRTDSSYKALFEVKTQFIELIKTFIDDKWVDNINEDNIELTSNEFVLENAHKRFSDLVYKIKIDGYELFFFLLELQQSVDKNMPFRLLEYMFEIWRKFCDKDKLPIIIPCVLYTGQSKWNVKDFKSLFESNKMFYKYIPNFKYILIDVNRYSDKELLDIANLISSLFFLNKTTGNEDALIRLETVIKNVSKLNEKKQLAFIRWSETMFSRDDKVYNYFEDNMKKEEEKMAFADYVPGMFELLRKQGESIGIEKGIERGITKGKTEVIKRLLMRKLKSYPTERVQILLENADTYKLEVIENKLFEITTWKEVEEILS